jgi:hypothetical protein
VGEDLAHYDDESPLQWLSYVLREAHLSYREASKLIGREESYFWQMLQKGRSRSLPTPNELARLVPRLRGVTLLEALEKVWNVQRSLIVTDLAVLSARGEADARWNELDPSVKVHLDIVIRMVLGDVDRKLGERPPLADPRP